MKLYWDPKEQSTKRHPVNKRYPKKIVQHMLVFESKLNICTRVLSFWCVLAYSWFKSYAPKHQYFITAIKHGYRCFIFKIYSNSEVFKRAWLHVLSR